MSKDTIEFTPQATANNKQQKFKIKSIKRVKDSLNNEKDIAILKTHKKMNLKHYANLPNKEETQKLKKGAAIQSIGYPYNSKQLNQPYLSKGHLTYIEEPKYSTNIYPEINFSLTTREGQSDAPIISKDNKVIGLIKSSFNSSGQSKTKIQKAEIASGQAFDYKTLEWINNNNK